MEGTQNSFGMQLFDFSLACTGLCNEEAARLNQTNICKVVYTDDIALNFIPSDADRTSVTLIYDEITHVVVGCQVLGTRDSTGLIDFMSICVQHEMTVQDILMSEICSN